MLHTQSPMPGAPFLSPVSPVSSPLTSQPSSLISHASSSFTRNSGRCKLWHTQSLHLSSLHLSSLLKNVYTHVYIYIYIYREREDVRFDFLHLTSRLFTCSHKNRGGDLIFFSSRLFTFSLFDFLSRKKTEQ